MVEIRRTWETVYFIAYTKKNTATIELQLNHQTKSYKLMTSHQELVSFNDDPIEVAELKLEALKSAIAYIKKHLK